MKTPPLQRLIIRIQGVVQGVGFRPFIYRLAIDMGLAGWVKNTSKGVSIELEGSPEVLNEFLSAIESKKPPLAYIHKLEFARAEPKGYRGFVISASETADEKTALVLPDIATCRDCLREIHDPENRRYRYPFTNCTNCGPRFSIITALPYDRPNTTMARFPMCDDCRAEYENPSDRRYHAQPIACPACGPHLELWDSQGKTVARNDEAVDRTAELIENGMIVAIKGLGGFQLIVDAVNDQAVRELRKRKGREDKPFALMFPSLDTIRKVCSVSEDERRLLDSPQSPIVLLNRLENAVEHNIVTPAVAPSNRYLGIMLPYTPLHHLLLDRLERPIVATSGNLSDEPICKDENDAVVRLAGIADYYLVHNRPIIRHVDDSIVRMVCGQPQILRRARGFAPLPFYAASLPQSILAVGGHLKNTAAVSVSDRIIISQHIGDLETEESARTFAETIADFGILHNVRPKLVACDIHPEYASTAYAQKTGIEIRKVQHHYAHILSCMAENEVRAPCLGICWDGTGYGIDKTIWGGEFLIIDQFDFSRLACFRRFKLPGGETAVREPRRSAIGALYEIYGTDVFEMMDLPPIMSLSEIENKNIKRMLAQNINSPVTSSAGRLFDAIASICGMRQICTFEGQAAMELEFAIDADCPENSYETAIQQDADPVIIDWSPILEGVVADRRAGIPIGKISAKFHNAMAHAIVAMAKIANIQNVVISGGCFQNRYLSETAVKLLKNAGFIPWWHRRIPPNDGGLSLGQVIAVQRSLRRK